MSYLGRNGGDLVDTLEDSASPFVSGDVLQRRASLMRALIILLSDLNIKKSELLRELQHDAAGYCTIKRI